MQLIAYYDEVDICNPLGSHIKKHKLGIVLYTLRNIAPKYRSQLKVINSAIIATVPVIEKYGLDKVLEPFIADLNALAMSGLTVSVGDEPRTFKGALLAFLADNLASNDLGGFKKSFSFSFHCCRTCLATQDTVSSAFISNGFQLRTDTEHDKQIKLLVGPTADHFSKTYGINRRSSLLDIKYFTMFGGGLPHDAMHDILEGVACNEIQLLLCLYITSHLFSLDKFNDRLLHFNFGYFITDKPIPILSWILRDKSIRSSAAQMLTLVQVLPFLIGDKISEQDDHWLCYLLLRMIIDIVLCPFANENLCSSLKLLIKEHHSKFISLYGSSSYTPKMHFLVHYPEQIQAVGPMVRTWTMRHEAKLNFFKMASRLVNFKNIPLTLANHHQRWMCYELVSGGLLQKSLQCGPAQSGSGVSLVKDENKDIRDGLISVLPQLSLEATVFRPTWVRRDGVLYQCNNTYLIIGNDGLDPVFGYLKI